MEVKEGMIFKHFKRDIISNKGNNYLYEVVCIATDADTGDFVVVYKALYPPFKTWTRPLSDFTGFVDKYKYPEAKQTFRFEPYTDSVQK